MDILKPLDQHGEWAYHFVFACAVRATNAVAERNWGKGPNFFELLVTFINLFEEYGAKTCGFSTKQNMAFGKDSGIGPALDARASLGYLTETEAGFAWTELVAPMMRASYASDDWPDPNAQE